jgi:hypothetical protein
MEAAADMPDVIDALLAEAGLARQGQLYLVDILLMRCVTESPNYGCGLMRLKDLRFEDKSTAQAFVFRWLQQQGKNLFSAPIESHANNFSREDTDFLKSSHEYMRGKWKVEYRYAAVEPTIYTEREAQIIALPVEVRVVDGDHAILDWRPAYNWYWLDGQQHVEPRRVMFGFGVTAENSRIVRKL